METPLPDGSGEDSGSETDAALALLAGQGDVHAFEMLLTRYERYIYKSAYYVTGSREDAADLSQEIFLRLWRGLSSYRGDAKFFTYLARITRNAAADWVRKQRTVPATVSVTPPDDESDLPEVTVAASPEETSPPSIAEQNERKQCLHRAMDGLSDDHRAVIVLRDMEGYSYERIAEMLGVDTGTVKSRLFRARKSLRTILEKQGFFL